MQTDPETELMKFIASLEGQLAGARHALDLVRASKNGGAQPLPIEQARSGRIHKSGIRDRIRSALQKVGNTFTPTDLEKVLKEDGQSIARSRLTTNLYRLFQRGEISQERDGTGGIEPIYKKK
jgi:hypothetical protein